MDINEIASNFLQANLERAVEVAASHAKEAKSYVRSKLARTYRDYLTRLLERYSCGKSFFIRGESVPLYDFFVPLDLATERRHLARPGIEEISAVSTASIIVGSGGSGKTMMMRHLLISSIRTRLRTPVFLELRQLNQTREALKVALLGCLTAYGLDVDDGYFERALEAGHFLIMLDGFDELEHTIRPRITNEIQALAQRYPGNWLILSSRHDPQLQGWDSFTHLNVCPLDLASATDLVQKVPFDDAIKDRFISDLNNGLFDERKSFLSNPLLLSIMLLTYSDAAHIPSKLSIFYTQAYESLFQKHDALKGGFQRERRSGLDIQDFARAFSAFCIQSYDRRAFSFPPTQALEFFEAAKSITQLSFDTDAILHDSMQAICLLLEEGIHVTFAHRSFQEYFVARFISDCPPDIKRQLVRRFAPSVESDSVLSILYELDPYTVEQEYILPAIETIKRRIKLVRNLGITHYVRFLKAMFGQFDVYDPGRGEGPDLAVSLRDASLYAALEFIHRHCQTEIPNPGRVPESLSSQELHRVFVEEFGRVSVPSRKLTSRSRFARALYDNTGHWGGQRLKTALSAESLIRARHKQAHESLDKLLSSTSRRRM
jgi:hypothetical protein